MENLIDEQLNQIINETDIQKNVVPDFVHKQPDANSETSNENNTFENEQPESIDSFKTKSNRGRHKKDCECDKCKVKKGIEQNSNSDVANTDSNSVDNNQFGNQNSKITDSNPLDLSEFKKVEISTQSNNQSEVNASKYLTGAIILMMVDAVIPSVLIKMMSIANPKYKSIKTKEIKMSKEQKNDLEPLADEVVKSMTVNMSPMTAFLVCTSLIYGTNIMSATDE